MIYDADGRLVAIDYESSPSPEREPARDPRE